MWRTLNNLLILSALIQNCNSRPMLKIPRWFFSQLLSVFQTSVKLISFLLWQTRGASGLAMFNHISGNTAFPLGGGTQKTYFMVRLTPELQNSSPPLHLGPYYIQNGMFRAAKSQLVILAEWLFSLEFHYFEELLATTWLSCGDKSSYSSLNHNRGRAF